MFVIFEKLFRFPFIEYLCLHTKTVAANWRTRKQCLYSRACALPYSRIITSFTSFHFPYLIITALLIASSFYFSIIFIIHFLSRTLHISLNVLLFFSSVFYPTVSLLYRSHLTLSLSFPKMFVFPSSLAVFRFLSPSKSNLPHSPLTRVYELVPLCFVLRVA